MEMGAEFKHLRELKGYSAGAVSSGIVTLNRLNAFESDEGDIPLDKLRALLLQMGVSLREFAHFCERMEINKGTLRKELNKAYAAKDVNRLQALFTMLAPENQEPQRLQFYGRMTAAGAYYELTGTKLASAEELQRLVDMLLETVTWNESEVSVLHATLILMTDNQVFMLCREVLGSVAGIRPWNFALYVSAWSAVMQGYRVLIQRRSNFVATLARQIDRTEPMAEAMLQNRFKYIFLNAIRAAQTTDSMQTRARVRTVYGWLVPIGPEELLAEARKTSIDVLGLDL
ncbi:helix-turn-helix domain-containing protein [Lacticaseibacillus zhaodongensis]|uniref:helix-turn-helix domain-containing protein n=1 Tax=Lacticaseibacillus zhaodongensis TaxID=2668065 RepID=UPI0012D36819|nr:helix-turn-helix transcriptional regulator [Lacticaseibacillus zhaodongensis]